MLCESCKKNNATFHYRYSENGKVTEAHLCNECAKKQGLVSAGIFGNDGLFGQSFMLDDNFGMGTFASLFSDSDKKYGIAGTAKVCPACGLSENELRRGGKLGCRECYNTFSDIIDGMLRKLHMSTEYKGKIPEGISESMSAARKIEKMKADMQKAVEQQNYEEAAKLRDAIRQLEDMGKSEE